MLPFRSVSQTVQTGELSHTHKHTDATKRIISPASPSIININPDILFFGLSVFYCKAQWCPLARYRKPSNSSTNAWENSLYIAIINSWYFQHHCLLSWNKPCRELQEWHILWHPLPTRMSIRGPSHTARNLSPWHRISRSVRWSGNMQLE